MPFFGGQQVTLIGTNHFTDSDVQRQGRDQIVHDGTTSVHNGPVYHAPVSMGLVHNAPMSYVPVQTGIADSGVKYNGSAAPPRSGFFNSLFKRPEKVIRSFLLQDEVN